MEKYFPTKKNFIDISSIVTSAGHLISVNKFSRLLIFKMVIPEVESAAQIPNCVLAIHSRKLKYKKYIK